MDFEKNDDNYFGSLRISEDVIATVAKTAALEIDGVENVSTSLSGMRGLITKTKYVRPIRIELSEEVVNVEISIVVKHGTKIPELANAVQQNIKNSIQSMTGLAVARVDVVVAGVTVSDSDESDTAE
ncbi:MAG: Asp23/Gls24 family envelope stress response protein [Oscillospiraceae bacterium]